MMRLFLISSVMLISACSFTDYNWQPVSYDTHVVWADDDSELAVGTTFFEERDTFLPLFDETEKRRFAYRLFLVKPDGTERRIISTFLPHQLEHLYYMKKAGYLLAESYVDMNGAKQVHAIDLQGKATLIASIPPLPDDDCGEETEIELTPRAIPSPDGQLLAHAYRSDCQKITVGFYSPVNAMLIDKQILEVPNGHYEMTWRQDNMLILAQTNLSEAWKLTPEKPPVITPAPNCFQPVTRSSKVSASGKVVRMGEKDIYISDTETQTAFGCQ